ncbi:unnamed protein product [Arctogadus glacialis]
MTRGEGIVIGLVSFKSECSGSIQTFNESNQSHDTVYRPTEHCGTEELNRRPQGDMAKLTRRPDSYMATDTLRRLVETGA